MPTKPCTFPTERRTVIECMEKIRIELQYPIDKHSRSLIVDTSSCCLIIASASTTVSSFTRDNANHDLLARFEDLLDEYFASDAPARHGGMPTVQYCAYKLCLSPNYFSDLIEKRNGNACPETHPAENARCR